MDIPLGGRRGGVTKVSPEDHGELKQYQWWSVSNEKNIYVQGRVDGNLVLMHRHIMRVELSAEADKSKIVDHRDGIGLNNQRENLRLLTRAQNAENRSKEKGKYKSDFYGVHAIRDFFVVRCTIDRKNIRISRGFKTDVEAAEAYDMHLVHNEISHRRLNFEEKREFYKTQTYIPPNTKQVSKTGYKGVYTNGKYHGARCWWNGKQRHLGSNKDPKVCARLYDHFVVDKKIPGKLLNFPNEHSEYAKNRAIKTLCEDVDETSVKLLFKTSSRNIIVDKDVYEEKIKYYAWYFDDSTGYPSSNIDGKTSRLHRFIMDVVDPDIFIDHIDRDPYNNRKSNLRRSSVQLNGQNKSKQEGTSSQYMGVSYFPRDNAWSTYVYHDGIRKFRSAEKTEEYAARRRDLYIIDNLHDTTYNMNFVWTDEELIHWRQVFSGRRKIVELSHCILIYLGD